MSLLALPLACALLATLPDGAQTAPSAAASDARTERARAAFALLPASEQRDVVDFLGSEVEHLRTFQMSLVRWVRKTQERDPGTWPDAVDAPWFDPAEHAPAQPIPRRRLPRTDGAAKTALATLGPRPERPRRAWDYDPGTRELRRLAGERDPQRIFENALLGLPPGFDLVEALIERALDDGAEQKSLAAFGHAYTDRDGDVFPGVTLYDAWASGREIEMPDVDCLGIVHSVLGDWTSWTAPVPGPQQVPLYQRIGELFQRAHRHRELRRALARTFVVDTPALCCGYEASLDNLHALWEDCESTPDTLRARLPAAERWKEFLSEWTDECYRRAEMFQRGSERRRVLLRDEGDVRATVERVLDEYGAFARLDARARAAPPSKSSGARPPAKTP